MSNPSVSCLLLAWHNNNFLDEAINSFLNQTYSNKNLVVIYDGDNDRICEYISHINDDNIIKISVEPGLGIADKRNLSMAQAPGEYLAVWDDDDWYDKERISTQMRAITTSHCDACVLTRVTLVDMLSNKTYISGDRLWENTLVFRNENLPLYPDAPGGGDTSFMRSLCETRKIVGILRPNLYKYRLHGENYWAREHWEANLLPFAEEVH